MVRRVSISRRGFIGLVACAAAVPSLLAGCDAGSLTGSTPSFEVLEVERTFTVSLHGETLFGIDLNVRNNTSSEISGSSCASDAQVKQGDDELSTGSLPAEVEGVVGEDATVAPGEEGTIEMVWELENDDEPVAVVVRPYDTNLDDRMEVLNEEFKLADAEKIESTPSFDLTVDNSQVVDDGQGGSLLLLTITFTNKADDPVSYLTAVDPQLYQNGVELKSGYLPYGHPNKNQDLEDNCSINVKYGASVQLMDVYKLYDPTSPVELMLVDRASYDQRAVVDTTLEIS